MLLTHTLHDDSEGPIKSPQAAAAEEVAGAARAKAGSAAVDALLSPARANCAVGIPSSSSILVGTSTGSIIVLDCVGSKVTVSQSLTAHSEPISHMAARGDIVITADEGGAATVWDAKSLSATCTLPQQECVIGFSVPQSSPLHPAPRNPPRPQRLLHKCGAAAAVHHCRLCFRHCAPVQRVGRPVASRSGWACKVHHSCGCAPCRRRGACDRLPHQQPLAELLCCASRSFLV